MMNVDIPENMQRLLKIKLNQADKTRQNILNVLSHVGVPISPQDIEYFLYLKAKAEVERDFKDGESLANMNKKDLNKKIKDKTVDIRTIHTHLSKLVKEGIVENKNHKYSLTVEAKSDIRYFAADFGNLVLSMLMDTYTPDNYTIEKNAKKLVELFGSFILFCLIETARPIDDTAIVKKSGREHRERLVLSCLQNIVPIEIMYNYFLAILDYGLNNTTNNDSGNNNRRDNYDRKRAIDLLNERLSQNEAEHSPLKEMAKTNPKRAYELFEKSKPYFELDEGTLTRFSNVLKKMYPTQFGMMSEVMNYIKANPKQKIEDIRNGWPPPFYLDR